MNFPIIRLEIEGMKHTVLRALSEHAAQMDTVFQESVKEYCTPENINNIVSRTAKDALESAIKEEVRSFFEYGKTGRLAVREAVEEWLNKIYPKS